MERFIDYNGITEAGHEVLDFIESQIKYAGRNVNKMNGLPGYAKNYLVNVNKMKAMNSAQWLQEHITGAEAAWNDMVRLREAEESASTQSETNSALVEQLEALRAELGTLRTELAELKESSPAKAEAEPVEEETVEEDTEEEAE